jgi:8-hydroxy-5-deazaflavin:NADPH oxidoreductase
MRIGVLGTATVGQTIAEKLASLDHDVMVGTRDPEETLSRTTSDKAWVLPFGEWHRSHEDVLIGTFAEAAAYGELVVNGTSGSVSLDALDAAGAENLDGKILIDIANPLDYSQGMPPSLSVVNTDSLGEQIQRALPGARVVKTLNTVTARVMVEPGEVGGGDHTMFVCGNDSSAKEEVTTVLKDWFGWRDVLDLGDITNARAMEMYLPLWVRLLSTLSIPMFNVKVVR